MVLFWKSLSDKDYLCYHALFLLVLDHSWCFCCSLPVPCLSSHFFSFVFVGIQKQGDSRAHVIAWYIHWLLTLATPGSIESKIGVQVLVHMLGSKTEGKPRWFSSKLHIPHLPWSLFAPTNFTFMNSLWNRLCFPIAIVLQFHRCKPVPRLFWKTNPRAV